MSSKMFGLLLVILFGLAVFIGNRIDQRAEEIREAKQSAPEAVLVEDREIETTSPEAPPAEVKALVFKSVNPRFSMARVSLKNHEGRVAWGQLPTIPERGDDRRVVINLPENFELEEGLVVTVHFADGPITRFGKIYNISGPPENQTVWADLVVTRACISPVLIPMIYFADKTATPSDWVALPENWKILTECSSRYQ